MIFDSGTVSYGCRFFICDIQQMNCIVLDTATEWVALGVYAHGQLWQADAHIKQGHAEYTLPQLRQLLEQANLTLAEIDLIVVGNGPGAFTGLRIGCGLAQGLAFAHHLPLMPVSTLAAVAASTEADYPLVAMDARMGEIYFAAYQAGAWQQPIVSPQLTTPEHIAALPTQAWTGCGTAWSVYTEALQQAVQDSPLTISPVSVPSSAGLLRLALSGQFSTVSAEQLSLLYLRDKVALKTHERH